MSGIKIDTLQMSPGGDLIANGPVAHRLMQANFNVNALRTCDTLRKDEWKHFDERLIPVARARLVGVNALVSRGLRFNVANALGKTQIEWETVGEMTDANVSMDGVTPGERDRLNFALKSMPLPIIHKDFSINIRSLMASRESGQSLDTAQAEMATRLVSEQVEKMLFVGHAIQVLSSSIAGLTTHTDRNTETIADWSNGATTGETKVGDVIDMMAKLHEDNMYGPYGIFVSQTAYTLLAEDYKTESDKTQLQRLLEIPGIEFILPTKDIAANAVIMIQLTNDVVDEVMGMQPTMVQWEQHGGFQQMFKVMAIMVPRVKSTQTGQSGICHGTP